MFRFSKKKSAKPSESGIDRITDAAVADVKGKWNTFHTTMHFKDDVPLSTLIDTFSQPIFEFFKLKYPALLVDSEIFWLTIFTAVLESGSHSKEDVNHAVEVLKRKYSPSASKAPSEFVGILQKFISTAQTCAQEYYSNAEYIEKELPNVTMTKSLSTMTLRICGSLKSVRHEIYTEFQKWKESPVSEEHLAQQAFVVKDILGKDLQELHVLAMSLRAQAEADDRKFGSANLLVGESATNIYNEFSSMARVAEELDNASKRA